MKDLQYCKVAVFAALAATALVAFSARASVADFDVRYYGATGDGTIDDGPPIQRAIDAAIHSGQPRRVAFLIQRGRDVFIEDVSYYGGGADGFAADHNAAHRREP